MVRAGGVKSLTTANHRSRSHDDEQRWIGSSLARAMRRAQLSGIVLVQLVLLAAALGSEISEPDWVAALVTGTVILAGLAVWVFGVHSLVLIIPYYLALGFYYVVADGPNDPLLGVLIPLTSWTIPLAVMLRQGKLPMIVPWILVALCTGLIFFTHPDWEPSVLAASLVTNVIILTAATVFMRSIYRIAGTLDRQKRYASDQEIRAIQQRVAQETATEYVRVLHDTIINTFGALARDDRGVNPVDARERCRRDLERIRAFQHGNVDSSQGRLSLTDLDYVGLPVRWGGLSGDDLRRFQALLPVPVLNALYGCASEAVLNATKHSGAEEVSIDIQYAKDMFHVEISDDGFGFNSANVIERGIDESIFRRGRDQGIAVRLHTESGTGTTVQLSYSLNTKLATSTTPGNLKTVSPLHDFVRGMGLAWSVLAVSAGILLELFSTRGASTSTYVLLVGLMIFSTLVWFTSRNGRAVPTPLAVLMIIAIPAANWCALVGIGYGSDAPYLFQAISLTVLPVLVYVSRRTLASYFLAVGLHTASTLIIVAIQFSLDSERWVGAILLEAPTLALMVVWFVFLRMFRSIGIEIADSRRSVERAMRESAASDAATEVQLQWSASGLQEPFQLLQGIAEGSISLSDPGTRQRCSDEEIFLRQISALPHVATFMGRWFALALAEARRNHIQLELHAENAYIEDEQNANAFGQLVLACIAEAPQDCRLIVTFLQHETDPLMLVVEQGSVELAERLASHRSERLTVTIHTAQDNAIIEASVAGENHS